MLYFHREGVTRRLIGVWVLAGFTFLTLFLAPVKAAQSQESKSNPTSTPQPELRKLKSQLRISKRQKDMAVIKQELGRKKVRKKLKQLGFTQKEIEERLKRLSDKQIHTMARRINRVKAGGHRRFPEAPGHPVLLILFIILIPLIAVIWLIFSLFHRHPHHPHGGPPGPPHKVPPGHQNH